MSRLRLLSYILLAYSALSAPFPPPLSSRVWLFFGANSTATQDTPAYLALAAAGGIAGYGWQQASVLQLVAPEGPMQAKQISVI
jgi:hypothetical protein